MQIINPDTFTTALARVPTIKPRIKREVRFAASVADMTERDWAERELVAIYDRSRTKGVLIMQPYDALYMVAFESGGVVRDSGSGRSKSVICDFCYSWRAGGNAGLVTFYADARSHDSTSQLCCLDLLCSLHVRTKTKDALLSRAQLREHMSDDDRIVRLKEHLQSFIDKLNLQPVDIG